MFVVHRTSRSRGRLTRVVLTVAGGRRRRKDLIRPFCLAGLLAVTVPAIGAGSAFAGRLTITPQIQGAGSVTTTSYGCTNGNTNENAAPVTCPTIGPLDPPVFGTVSRTLTATPRGGGGWTFSGWTGSGCSGTSPTCTLSRSFFDLFDLSVVPRAVFVDNAAPSISIVIPSYSTSDDRTVTFFFGADESPVSFECSMDSTTSFGPCSSGAASARFTLPEGGHVFRVRATDFSGQTGPTFTQNARIIDTQLVSGPKDFSSVKRPTFTYSSASGLDFRCSVDSLAISTPCGPKNLANNRASFTPPANLPDGAHTFRVQAFDGPDFDRVPIERSWTVDSTPPDTSLSSEELPQGVLTTLLDAKFTFASTEPVGAVLQCKLDAAAFSTCTSPRLFANLPFGPHKFQARAIDRAGNVDPTPAFRDWTIAAKDADSDGFNQRTDCNDNNANINPAKAEILDNDVDENCDGIKGVNLDRDNDGIQRPTDCDDSNPAIHPGAVDIPGNALDEDCVNGPAPKALESMNFTLGFSFAGSFTRLKPFTVNGAPIGAKVTVACKGKGCPKKKTSFKVTKDKQKVKKYAGKQLKAGWILTFTVKRAGFITGVKTLKIRRGKSPLGSAVKCLPPGAKKPVPCSA